MLSGSTSELFHQSERIGFELLQFTFVIDHDANPWLVDVTRDPDIVAKSSDQLGFFDKLVDDVLK